MRVQLAMGFGLTFELPAELATSYALPSDLFPFWRAVEPSMHVILNRHPRRVPGDPLDLVREFHSHMLTVPRVKDIRRRWRSTDDVAAQRPGKNVAYWQQYDPQAVGQLPYSAWFLKRFSEGVTKIGLF